MRLVDSVNPSKLNYILSPLAATLAYVLDGKLAKEVHATDVLHCVKFSSCNDESCKIMFPDS